MFILMRHDGCYKSRDGWTDLAKFAEPYTAEGAHRVLKIHSGVVALRIDNDGYSPENLTASPDFERRAA